MINIEFLFVNSFLKVFTNFIDFTELWEPLPVTPDTAHASGIHAADADSVFLRAGVHDHAVAHIDAHMSVVADHISGLLVRIADRTAPGRQRTGLPRYGDAEMSVYQIHESRAVRSVRQAVPAEHIGTTHKLLPVGSDGTSQPRAPAGGSSGGTAAGRTAAR